MCDGGKAFRFADTTRIAHFAPEKGLTIRLRDAAPTTYMAYDFEPTRYRHLDIVKPADLSDLTIESDSVDLLVCNHVIEHVPDVAKALSEIYRVLAPGGAAVLQVPIALNLAESIELPLESSEQERIEAVGQDDHLRLFNAPSYLAALTGAGFDVEQFKAFEHDDKKATEWMLDPLEVLHICSKEK